MSVYDECSAEKYEELLKGYRENFLSQRPSPLEHFRVLVESQAHELNGDVASRGAFYHGFMDYLSDTNPSLITRINELQWGFREGDEKTEWDELVGLSLEEIGKFKKDFLSSRR